MELTEDRIRSLCTSEVFDRGINYYKEGRIKQVDRYGSTVTASVIGSQPQPYSVEIELDDEIMATCSCPYDWGGYCKHIIAVLLRLNDEPVESTKEDVEEVIENVRSDELRDFLLSEFEKHQDMRNRFLARFGDTEEKSVHDYKKEMDKEYRDHDRRIYRYEGPDFSEYEELAENHLERGEHLEAAKIYRAMTEVRVENLGMVEEWTGDDFEEKLDSLVEILENAPVIEEDDEKRREYIDYFFEEWVSKDRDFGFIRDMYKEAVFEISRTEGDYQHLKERLEDEIPDEVGEDRHAYTEARHLVLTYLEVLDKLDYPGEKREVYEKYYLDIPEVCLEYVERLRILGETKKAIEVAERGVEAFSDSEPRRNSSELREVAAELRKEEGDIQRYKEHVSELFNRTSDWDYYEELKEVCDEDEWIERVKEYEKKFEKGSLDALVELYLREDRKSDAFDTVIEATYDSENGNVFMSFSMMSEEGGLKLLSSYREDVADHDPRRYYDRYKELLEPFAANDTGRRHYRKIVEYLEEMKELGFEEDLREFVEHLKEKHSNRPAFLDEMQELELDDSDDSG